MASLADRMIRAARLDPALYEEVEADQEALPQAMIVVLLSSAAAGIGTSLHMGFFGLLMGAFGALLGWFLWAFTTYFIGTKILPEEQTDADLGQLMRTIGFSTSPGVLRVFGVIPGLGAIVNLLVFFWTLAAMVVAVRQALDYKSTGRAVGVCLLGALLYIAVFGLIAAIPVMFGVAAKG